MTQAVPHLVLAAARSNDMAAMAAGLAVLATLLLALVAKVLLKSARRSPRGDGLRLLDVVIAPLLVVFAFTVLERFRDLS
jgi:hypothetical protein